VDKLRPLNAEPAIPRLSLYEFGGSDEVVRRIQSNFVKFFLNSGPVLDIGCGRGTFLEVLSGAGIEALGIDSSEESLAICRKKGLQVERHDARDFMACTPRQFGGIFCSHVIEHMDYAEAMELLALCHRKLRPEGTLLLVTPNPEDLAIIAEVFWLDPTHVRPYPRLLLENMLRASGFKVVLTRQFLGTWRMVGRRNLPMYFLRRALLGRYFGKPNTLVLSRRSQDSASCARVRL
jgi:2-polyprenyl-3-methyl-5-hydroxy-6-metoxy-1,4-benzoquinol methylase